MSESVSIARNDQFNNSVTTRLYLAAGRESKPDILIVNTFVVSVCERTVKNVTFKFVKIEITRHVTEWC